MKKLVMVFISVFLIASTIPANAAEFWRVGKITKTLSQGSGYGGCMIEITAPIGNGCPGRWVSLDCDGLFYPESAGKRSYASATVAASTDKLVSVRVDNTKKHNGYCVSKRLDVIF